MDPKIQTGMQKKMHEQRQRSRCRDNKPDRKIEIEDRGYLNRNRESGSRDRVGIQIKRHGSKTLDKNPLQMQIQ